MNRRLATFFMRQSHKPFRWGECDCAVFAAAALIASGRDLADTGIRQYGNADEARAALHEAGFATLADAASAATGLRWQIPAHPTNPADLIFLPDPPIGMLLVWDGVGAVSHSPRRGLRRIGIKTIRRLHGMSLPSGGA